MTFEELDLNPQLLKAIKELGFEEAMPVQEKTIPHLLNSDVNLIALAQTGTGKTAAFGLPLIQKLDYDNKRTEVLIICPTRELCMQIANDCKKFAKYIPQCSVVPVYGGASIDIQIRAIKQGAKIIVATPGRMNDLILRKKVDISNVRYVVLDEADEMLNMGFKDDLDSILSNTPDQRNTLLFSATMPKEVEAIAKDYITDPIRIQIGERNQGSDNVKHFYYFVHAKNRYLALKRIADYYPDIYAIIFCRTKIETQEVADMLIKDGYNADSLHGDLSQAQRDHVMSRFRLQNIQMLVATDVAARGLDVHNLTHVINYNLPDELEQYVHRSGRTGRADKQGISIAIINMREKYKIRNIEKLLKKDFEKAQIPTGKQVCQKQLFNMINKVEMVDVNYDEIEAFIPQIVTKLSWMDREELIRKFVSLEFNRFLDYYKNAPDLNIDERAEKNSRDRDRDRGGERGNDRKDRGRSKTHSDEGFVRLFFNVGHRDNIVPQRIIGMINDNTPHTRIAIGRIDIMDNFSYVEVGSDNANEVIEAFEGKFAKGRPILVEVAANKPAREKRGDGRERGDNRERRSDNREKRGGDGREKRSDSREKRTDSRDKKPYSSKDKGKRLKDRDRKRR
ncbi:MAG: DEAD/DEAH box helicase [Bacteroidales bacterium]|jgi:ATP-dependent RNA helicase DeaD|nr:DEAD/DEAH box helicase [Bacteroidales bacterium]